MHFQVKMPDTGGTNMFRDKQGRNKRPQMFLHPKDLTEN